MSAAALPRNNQADQSFGRRLRRERERRKIALASIADNTKISVSLFEDLERDDASRWPSGIFRKSFIRAYAKAVGLDPDDTVREFLERFPDPNDPELSTLAAPPTPPQPPAVARPVPATPPVVTTTAAKPPAPAAKPPAPAASATPPTWPTTTDLRSLSYTERAMSIAWDAGMIITFGLLLYAIVGSLWMPLALVMAIYYGGGILLFGSTPGAALNTPSATSFKLRRSGPSSPGKANKSTGNDPSRRSDGSPVRRYRAREI